jgi:transposase
VLGLDKFNEDDSYDNWLRDKQALNEDRLLKKRPGKTGLLRDELGVPLSVEVFAGNTQDPRTFASRVRKAAERFGADAVTFVGDRGMIKSEQVEDLGAHGFHYITAITKPRIETLLNGGVIRMGLFDRGLAEVAGAEAIRYVLRRNPARAEEVRKSREDKLKSPRKELDKQQDYLKEHPRAKVETALEKLREKCNRLKLSKWVSISAEATEITLSIDNDALKEEAKLDGCYVLKSDLSPEAATKEIIHDRYKDLASAEQTFRNSKTAHLELRPIHVRLAIRTRGHVFVVMMAYRIIEEMAAPRCDGRRRHPGALLFMRQRGVL